METSEIKNETGDRGKLMSLADAAKSLPVPTTYQTVHRWAVEGVRVGDQTIRLRTISYGIRIFTSAEYLSAFQAAIDAARKSSDGEQPR